MGARVFAAGVAGGGGLADELALFPDRSAAFAEFLVGVHARGLSWQLGGCRNISISFEKSKREGKVNKVTYSQCNGTSSSIPPYGAGGT